MNPLIAALVSILRQDLTSNPGAALDTLQTLLTLIAGNPSLITLVAPYVPDRDRPLLTTHAGTLVKLAQADLPIIREDPTFLTDVLHAAGVQ